MLKNKIVLTDAVTRYAGLDLLLAKSLQLWAAGYTLIPATRAVETRLTSGVFTTSLVET